MQLVVDEDAPSVLEDLQLLALCGGEAHRHLLRYRHEAHDAGGRHIVLAEPGRLSRVQLSS